MRKIFKRRPGEGTPMTLAIVLVLLMLFAGLTEYCRVWIIAQGVEEAAQEAVLSVINDNYNEVYHAAREGYAAGWFPDGESWEESVDEGDVYGQLSRVLGLYGEGDEYRKFSGSEVEYSLSCLEVTLDNNALASGESEGYTATIRLDLSIPIRFLGKIYPYANVKVQTQAKYMPLF